MHKTKPLLVSFLPHDLIVYIACYCLASHGLLFSARLRLTSLLSRKRRYKTVISGRVILYSIRKARQCKSWNAVKLSSEIRALKSYVSRWHRSFIELEDCGWVSMSLFFKVDEGVEESMMKTNPITFVGLIPGTKLCSRFVDGFLMNLLRQFGNYYFPCIHFVWFILACGRPRPGVFSWNAAMLRSRVLRQHAYILFSRTRIQIWPPLAE